MLRSIHFVLIATLPVFSAGVMAEESNVELSGHTKIRFLAQDFPGDSVFHKLAGSSAFDGEAELRLNFELEKGPWSLDAAYQLFAASGDRIEYTRLLPNDSALLTDRLPNDARRLFKLTNVIKDKGKSAAVHRLDRLWVGYTSEKTVLRFGRQAITWGNGLVYSPMDIVNPFDPAAVDTEYKPGDDMLYGQYLRDNGHDIQVALVFRRNFLTDDVTDDESTFAVKYHGIGDVMEYDLMFARNYGNITFGIGGNRSFGGALWRGDLIVADADSGTRVELVTNLSYSWVWGGKNTSGLIEYYFNDYGQKDGRYDPQSLRQNPELLQRIARGETFSLGRHYIAGGLNIEMTPLWTLIPNLFANVEDGSALLQIVTRYNLGENLEFLGALNIPIGPNGTEFGGIESGVESIYNSTNATLFAQLAWYF